MTDPQSDFSAGAAPQPPRRKAFSPAMLIAIGVVAVLAVVVVVVALTRDSGDNVAGGDTGTTSATQSSESESSEATDSSGTETAGSSGSTATVTDSASGLAYDYPLSVSPFEESKWSGPGDLDLGTMAVTSLVGYESCTPDAGVDILFGFTTSSETDLATAAQTTYTTATDNLISDKASTANEAATTVSTDGGLTGELYEGDLIRSGADECGNTTLHVVAFAVADASGQTQVLIGSYRMDGDNVGSEQELLDATIAVFKSLRSA